MINNSSLIITAHPDDETIFFAGLALSDPNTNWKVICVTDGNADGQGEERLKQLNEACQQLNIQEVECLSVPDIYQQRLDVRSLTTRLASENCSRAFTHGILGEYGHPHHQDVCLAVHRALGHRVEVFSVAYNCYPELIVSLSEEQWEKKAKVLSAIYYNETHRFIRFLPATWTEGFCQISQDEVEAIYSFLTKSKSLEKKHLNKYLWFAKYLENESLGSIERPF